MSVHCGVFPHPNHEIEVAIREGGGEVIPTGQAEVLIHTGEGGAERLAEILGENPAIRWVQLRGAGINQFVPLLDRDRVWTSAKGAYSRPVAEHALALSLAGMRGPIRYARRSSWSEPYAQGLHGADVVILGGGGVARHLIRLLQPFDVNITVVRREPNEIPGVTVVTDTQLEDAVTTADLLVVAAALTDETQGIVDLGLLRAMHQGAWLVNVARGAHIVTADLVSALEDGEIQGAALDVTDPEPLPDNHPLWDMPNVLITPHVGSPPAMHLPYYLTRVHENVGRYAAGQPLIGKVDPELGY